MTGVQTCALPIWVGAILFAQKPLFGEVAVAWPWWIPISAVVTFSVVCLFSPSREQHEIGTKR